ncbi:MAG: hypothetical protein L0Y50_03955, partial [Beijerinckiaceae bacterium]|nr:hypothetical protein [Beijerinckiaceae bacterium]
MQAGACPISRFAPANVFANARARLTHAQPLGWRGARAAGPGGGACLRPAAVLIGLADYASEVSVILTQRTAALRDHSGRDRGHTAQPLRKALFLMWRALIEPVLLFASPF